MISRRIKVNGEDQSSWRFFCRTRHSFREQGRETTFQCPNKNGAFVQPPENLILFARRLAFPSASFRISTHAPLDPARCRTSRPRLAIPNSETELSQITTGPACGVGPIRSEQPEESPGKVECLRKSIPRPLRVGTSLHGIPDCFGFRLNHFDESHRRPTIADGKSASRSASLVDHIPVPLSNSWTQ